MRPGSVALVGTGPGHPGLVTLRALELTRRADVVVYDYLGAAELVNAAPEGAEKVYVGKTASRHTLTQEAINELLVRLAREGKRVVRLK
ncbi:MAG: SAM-dependent methyltransferase, partial [Verrucomicrobiia bacterium]